MNRISVLIVRFSLAYLLIVTAYSNLFNYPDGILYNHHTAFQGWDFLLIFLMLAYMFGGLTMLWGRYLCCASALMAGVSLLFACCYYAEFSWLLSFGLIMLSTKLLLINQDGCRDVLVTRLHRFNAVARSVLGTARTV
ncbi:MAG: hypothetical protein OEZ68_19290 [Gammaproteobacteria bacterium]|nr:hypothetical protein [Gammaproteobacteria bacterium]MDH5802954.1 hypothetical protein [Gammaproteobacteria bacterium]